MRELTYAVAAILAAVAVLAIPAVAGASTRTVTCGPVWVSGGAMGPGHSEKIRVKSWQMAPDVHRNIPCRVLLGDARRIVRHGTLPERMGGWAYQGDGRGWVQYYGGHGSELRIYWLAEVGAIGDD